MSGGGQRIDDSSWSLIAADLVRLGGNPAEVRTLAALDPGDEGLAADLEEMAGLMEQYEAETGTSMSPRTVAGIAVAFKAGVTR